MWRRSTATAGGSPGTPISERPSRADDPIVLTAPRSQARSPAPKLRLRSVLQGFGAGAGGVDSSGFGGTIMMCAPAVPGNMIQGAPGAIGESGRPVVSAVAYGM